MNSNNRKINTFVRIWLYIICQSWGSLQVPEGDGEPVVSPETLGRRI